MLSERVRLADLLAAVSVATRAPAFCEFVWLVR